MFDYDWKELGLASDGKVTFDPLSVMLDSLELNTAEWHITNSRSFIAVESDMKNLKNVRLQNDCFVSSGCRFDASDHEIRLGSHCIVGEDVKVLPPGEDVIFGNYVTVYPRCDIRAKAVGDHVEIGADSKVGEGVVVSASSVIQPESVVLPGTKVPTKCVFGGNPARYVVELPDAINGTIRLRNERLLSRLR